MAKLPLSRRDALAAALALAAAPALGQEETGPPAAAAEPGKAPAPKRIVRPRLPLPPTPGLPASARTGTVSVNGQTLFYAEAGAGESVLFLHGGFGSANYWGQQIAALSETHHVVAMDTRGHGRSPVMAKSFGFPLFASDVEGLLDHLALPSAAIVGWSDGGITGLQLAMTRPQRVKRLFAFGANASAEGLMAGGSKAPAFAAYAARCKVEYQTLSPAPERWPDLAAGLSAMWRSEPNYAWGRLKAIGVPTTIAFGQHDEIIRREHAERIASTIPGARLEALKNVSHFAMLQDPAAFTAALRRFLAA